MPTCSILLFDKLSWGGGNHRATPCMKPCSGINSQNAAPESVLLGARAPIAPPPPCYATVYMFICSEFIKDTAIP